MIKNRIELVDKLSENIAQYSPVVIQGDDGVGKSFFLEMLCEKLIANNTIKNYLIQSSWEYQKNLIKAIEDYKTHKFIDSYLSFDLIAIDDIQCLAERVTTTQEELLHIFKTFKKPIIITTNCAIEDCSFRDDFVQFLSEGTSITLNRPSKQDVLDMLIRHIGDAGIILTVEAIEWLKTQSVDTISKSKGIFKKIKLYSDKKNIDLNEIKEILN